MKRLNMLFLPVAAAICFAAAGSWNHGLLKQRSGFSGGSPEAIENAPPLMVFTTVVLGGFRGLLADMLWLRASSLQEEGKYFELVQLADWITTLEPRSTEVWAYHAWNMAYNVSIMMSDPADRWRWVQSGIRLLREEGMKYNAGDPDLYFELAWIYYHKIGGDLDPSHLYYKRTLALQVTPFLTDSGDIKPDPDAPALQAACGLTPEDMKEVDARYGPLDWRLPESHALYWSYLGRRCAGREHNVRCDRMIYQAMMASFLMGRLDFRPRENIYARSPRADLLKKTIDAFETFVAEHGVASVGVAYARFLGVAAAQLHDLHREDEAKEVFALWRRKFPSPDNEAGLEAFILARKARSGHAPEKRGPSP